MKIPRTLVTSLTPITPLKALVSLTMFVNRSKSEKFTTLYICFNIFVVENSFEFGRAGQGLLEFDGLRMISDFMYLRPVVFDHKIFSVI